MSKLRSGTSKTMQRPLFWKSHCAICSPVYLILYHVTGSCKGPITSYGGNLVPRVSHLTALWGEVASGGGKMRDPGNEVAMEDHLPCARRSIDLFVMKFTFFFPAISRSFFTENPMVDPWIKWRKSKDTAKKLNSTDAERTISGFVAYRTITLPFFTAGSSIVCHKIGLSLIVPACETYS